MTCYAHHRRVLDLAAKPSELSTTLQERSGLKFAGDLPQLSNEEKLRMKAMLMDMGGREDLVEMERDIKNEHSPNPNRSKLILSGLK